MKNMEQLSIVSNFYLEVYRAHYKYHNEKETLVWLATSAYILTAASATGWLLTHKGSWAHFPLLTAFALALYAALSTWFVVRQNLLKAHGALAVQLLENGMRTFDISAPTYLGLSRIIYRADRACCEQNRKNGWPGWILVMLMVAIGFCTVALVLCTAIEAKIVYWLVDLIPTHLLRPVIGL